MTISANQITPGHNHRNKQRNIQWPLAIQIAGGHNQIHFTISSNQITPGHNYTGINQKIVTAY